MPCSIHTQVYTLKSRFKASRLKVRPRYKVLCLILMVKIEFQMIKSSFDWKSRLNAGPRPDRSYTSNRDFTVHALKDEFVMKLNHVLWETFECKEFAFLCLTKKVEASCESASKIVSCVNGWAWMNECIHYNRLTFVYRRRTGPEWIFYTKRLLLEKIFPCFLLSIPVSPSRETISTDRANSGEGFIYSLDGHKLSQTQTHRQTYTLSPEEPSSFHHLQKHCKETEIMEECKNKMCAKMWYGLGSGRTRTHARVV